MCCLIAFIVTFLVTRLIVRYIRAHADSDGAPQVVAAAQHRSDKSTAVAAFTCTTW